MDTDDLTPMAYEMIPKARDVLDDLRLEIGVASRDFKTEDDCLRDVRGHLKDILRSADRYLGYHDLSGVVEVRPFWKGVKDLLAHVEKTGRVNLICPFPADCLPFAMHFVYPPVFPCTSTDLGEVPIYC